MCFWTTALVFFLGAFTHNLLAAGTPASPLPKGTLPAPAESNVKLGSQNTVILNFTPVQGALKYRVTRSMGNATGPFQLWAWIDKDVESTHDKIGWPSNYFSPGITYYFRISTLDSTGAAGDEQDVSGNITIPIPPPGCTLSAKENMITFGTTVDLNLVTTGNPESAFIDEQTASRAGGSSRFTPTSAGSNTVIATVKRGNLQASCSTVVITVAPPIPTTAGCTPYYRTYDAGPYGVWMGADVGLSLNLGDNRTLSLFGDSFLGRGGHFSRSGSQMVGNTISISSCNKGVYKPFFQWRGIPNNAQPFFPNNDPTFDRYWSTNQPWKAGDTLFVPLMAIQNINSFPFFQSLRTDVAVISNSEDLFPNRWNITYRTLFNISSFNSPTSQGSNNFWGAIYSLSFGDHIYLFNNSNNDLTMSRLSIKSLTQNPLTPSSSMEYLANNGKWKPGYYDPDAKKLNIHANYGLSVRYNFKLKKWMMVYIDTNLDPSNLKNTISVRTASSLTSPWSSPVNIFTIPEVTPGSPGYNQTHLCYQGFEHMAYNPDPDNQMAITYACNSFDLNYVASNMSIYFPKFLRVPIPPQLR